MPHDRDGKLLKVGDKVLVPCTIIALQEGTDYCNMTLATDEVMPPYESQSSITLNTKQAILVEEQSPEG